MLVKTYGSAVHGIDAITITIEVNISPGINYFLVGLPDSAVKESHQRIKAAFKNTNLHFPGKEITVNMAPADLRKEGSYFDLPIAIGILAASGQIKFDLLRDFVLVGELSLDGSVLPVKGVLPMAINALKDGYKGIILAKGNVYEAALLDGLDVYGIANLMELIPFFNGESHLEKTQFDLERHFKEKSVIVDVDFNDVKGQGSIKRAFEIAAAGAHNILLIGPPGAGKSMLAKRLPSILPPMTLDEALETTKIHSVAGKVKAGAGLLVQRPFRKPHHTISDVALVGGGTYPQPGEISLAHNGVLFLDELPEYKRSVLEVMRQPLEDRTVTISRSKFTVDYPAGFMLVATMNPCPCGYYNHPSKDCTCSPLMVQRYLNRISGPLLDRIDLHVEVVPVLFDDLIGKESRESSSEIRQRVLRARLIQEKRFAKNPSVHANDQMNPKDIKNYCALNAEGVNLLRNAMDKLDLSARAYDRILKVARTIADLNGEENLTSAHIAEAIRYRTLDRSSWSLGKP